MSLKRVFATILVAVALCASLSGFCQARLKTPDEIAAALPQPQGWVSDLAGIFTSPQANYLDSLISWHEKQTSVEIALVTIRLDSAEVPSQDEFADIALALLRKWGVGKKEKNNGILILLSTNRRYVRVEVGEGLAMELTDNEAKQIIDTIMIPAFREGAYFEGIEKGLSAIFRETSGK